MGEKGFIFILERVNLPKTGDVCIYMGENGRKRLHFHAGEGKPPQNW
jgi:hypothetical protein